jgi:hypothetical protein
LATGFLGTNPRQISAARSNNSRNVQALLVTPAAIAGVLVLAETSVAGKPFALIYFGGFLASAHFLLM